MCCVRLLVHRLTVMGFAKMKRSLTCRFHHSSEKRLTFVSEIVSILDNNDSRDMYVTLTTSLRSAQREQRLHPQSVKMSNQMHRGKYGLQECRSSLFRPASRMIQTLPSHLPSSPDPWLEAHVLLNAKRARELAYNEVPLLFYQNRGPEMRRWGDWRRATRDNFNG